MMKDGYLTLLEDATAEYVVNKSRFLCHAAPCQTEEEALAYLGEKRQRYRDATHNCYAYVIGENAGVIRYSDDGEPGGTAGLPMMEVLRARQVVNCCVVVTRYFGGVLLGAGGLVRAYSHSCALALDAAGVARMAPSERYLISVPYPLWDRVRYALRELPVRMEETEFAADVQATVLTRTADAEALLTRLTRETNAQAECLKIEELYAPWNTDQGEKQ
ncbi:MAG: YigZ family protein [Clostridia bacterium]|nr:YigZ family protein [Clostridia bacterium]